MIHLRGIGRKWSGEEQHDEFPFAVPAIRGLEYLRFSAPVTFFVGENGSGKSTLLEAIAAAMNAITVGGEDIERDETLHAARVLARTLELAKGKHTPRGFFLRSEDFFNFAKRMKASVDELEEIAADFDAQREANPKRDGLRLAAGVARGQKNALTRRYGNDLNAGSHGEGFLKLFQTRLVPDGLYLLDEPEAALSPTRQLSLLSLMKQMVAQNSQFIIATHSPILMAFPDAEILSFDQTPIAAVPYDELEHVVLTKTFLHDPQAFLRHL